MRVLICGSRNWIDERVIEREIRKHRKEIKLIIHGGARGADTLAGMIAHQLRIPVKVFPAQWKRFGRGAGHIRNQQMLDEGKPDQVWAFTEDLRSSRGTKDMVHRATKAQVYYRVIAS